MAKAINHDTLSSGATAGGEAVKWGLIGAVASFAIPAIVVGGLTFAVASGLGALGTALAVGLGIVAGAGGAAVGGSAMGIGGALVGAFKGGDKVSKEQQAFRAKVEARTHSREAALNDHEIKGVQQGYGVGRADGEAAGFEKGQQFVIQQLQQHMAEQQAQQSSFAEKVGGPRSPEGMKAASIAEQREVAAAAPGGVGGPA